VSAKKKERKKNPFFPACNIKINEQYGITMIRLFLSHLHINNFHISAFFLLYYLFSLIKQSNSIKNWSVNVCSTFFTIQYYYVDIAFLCLSLSLSFSFYSFVHNYHITHNEWNLMVASCPSVSQTYVYSCMWALFCFFNRLRCN
jgi:hypothetical protein